MSLFEQKNVSEIKAEEIDSMEIIEILDLTSDGEDDLASEPWNLSDMTSNEDYELPSEIDKIIPSRVCNGEVAGSNLRSFTVQGTPVVVLNKVNENDSKLMATHELFTRTDRCSSHSSSEHHRMAYIRPRVDDMMARFVQQVTMFECKICVLFFRTRYLVYLHIHKNHTCFLSELANQECMKEKDVGFEHMSANNCDVTANEIRMVRRECTGDEESAVGGLLCADPFIVIENLLATSPRDSNFKYAAEQPDETGPLCAGEPYDESEALCTGEPHDESEALCAGEPHDELEPLCAGEPHDESEPLCAGEPPCVAKPLCAAEPRDESEPRYALEQRDQSEPLCAAEPREESESLDESKLPDELELRDESELLCAAEPRDELESRDEPELLCAAEPRDEPEPCDELESRDESEPRDESELLCAAEPRDELEPRDESEPRVESELLCAAEPHDELEPRDESELLCAAEPRDELEPRDESELICAAELRDDSKRPRAAEPSRRGELLEEEPAHDLDDADSDGAESYGISVGQSGNVNVTESQDMNFTESRDMNVTESRDMNILSAHDIRPIGHVPNTAVVSLPDKSTPILAKSTGIPDKRSAAPMNEDVIEFPKANANYYTCKLCGYSIFIAKYVKLHAYCHCNKTRPQCEKCLKLFSRFTQLVFHKCDGKVIESSVTEPRSDNVNFNFDCKGCCTRFESRADFESHFLRHHVALPQIARCKICLIQFVDKTEMECHMKQTHPTYCDVCEKIFSSVDLLKTHKATHSVYSCSYCGEKFNTEIARKKHRIKFHSNQAKTNRFRRAKNPFVGAYSNYTCNMCEKGYSRLISIKYHSFKYCSRKPYVCEKCGKGFLESKHSRDHKCRHKPTCTHRADIDLTFRCKICDNTFDQRKLFEKHFVTLHTSRKQLQCHICSKFYVDRVSLNLHVKHTHMEKNLQCDVCHKRFCSVDSLKSHRTVHSAPTIQCEHCSKIVKSQSHLKMHLAQVHATEQLQCEICTKLFRSRQSLYKHTASVHSTKEYMCTLCPRIFKTCGLLKTHTQGVHGDSSLFPCSQCDKSFSSSTKLRRHEKSHEDKEERQYQCSDCGQQFVHKHHLTNHMVKHTGERPFKCELCQKSFGRKQILDTHMLSHTGAMDFPCDVCQKEFRRKTDLNKHKRLNHSNQT